MINQQEEQNFKKRISEFLCTSDWYKYVRSSKQCKKNPWFNVSVQRLLILYAGKENSEKRNCTIANFMLKIWNFKAFKTHISSPM